MPYTRSAEATTAQNLLSGTFSSATVSEAPVSLASRSQGGKPYQPKAQAVVTSIKREGTSRFKVPSPSSQPSTLRSPQANAVNSKGVSEDGSGEDEITVDSVRGRASTASTAAPSPQTSSPVDSLANKTTPSQASLETKERDLDTLRRELASLRVAFDDLQEAKTALATELHRVKQSESREGEGSFVGMHMRDGRGDSAGFQKILREREGVDEIPLFMDLPTEIEREGAVDLPPILVQADRFNAGGLLIKCEEAIGAGGNGKVIGGTILNFDELAVGSNEVVMKAVMKSGIPKWDEELFREIQTLKALGETGLAPSFIGAIETPLRVLVIMERYPMSLWDLSAHLAGQQNAELSTAVVNALARPLITLVYKLHTSGFIHRDLKPDNILIAESGEMVLADFGSTGRIGEKYDQSFGTSGFTAPYLTKRYQSDPRLDMWSFGATVLSLVGADLHCAEGPINEEVCQEVLERFVPKSAEPLAHDFLSKCLAFPRKGRTVLTAKAATEHPWLAETISEALERRLSSSIREAAREKRRTLKADSKPYYLNIGVGPCHELRIATNEEAVSVVW